MNISVSVCIWTQNTAVHCHSLWHRAWFPAVPVATQGDQVTFCQLHFFQRTWILDIAWIYKNPTSIKIILVALKVFSPICGPTSPVTILWIHFSSLKPISILGHNYQILWKKQRLWLRSRCWEWKLKLWNFELPI